MEYETKKTILGLTVISILISGIIFYPQPALAVAVAFSDGSTSAGISTNCASRTTVGTLTATGLGAGTNVVIATVDFVSSDAGVESVVQGSTSNGLYRDATQVVGTQYTFYVGTANQGEHYTYLLEDTGASANEVYTVETCVSATASTAEAKILAFQGLESSFVDSGNVATVAGSTVKIAEVTTDLTANNHIIIASIQIDCDGASTVSAGNILLRDSANATLASNQFHMLCGSASAGDGMSILLIGTNSAGSANTKYNVGVQETTSGLAGAEAKILAIKAVNDEYYFSDSGSTAVTNAQTNLNSIATSFYNQEQVVVLDATQYDDTDTGVETIDATTGHEINSGSTLAGNQILYGGLGASGSAGEGLRNNLVYSATLGSANPTFTSYANVDATGLNAESKILAFSLVDGTSDPNTGMQQNNMWIFAIGRLENEY